MNPIKKALIKKDILVLLNNRINGRGINAAYIVRGIIVHKSDIPHISKPGSQTIPLIIIDKNKAIENRLNSL